MPQGGYQKPSRPAPVSGPGRLSRRTDGGPGQPTRELHDAAYGEQATFRADQQAAPMATAPGALKPGQSAGPAVDLSRVVPFGAASQRPGEPITSGADAGPGPGAAALGLSGDNDPGFRYSRELLPVLELVASQPFASSELRQFVRRMRGGG